MPQALRIVQRCIFCNEIIEHEDARAAILMFEPDEPTKQSQLDAHLNCVRRPRTRRWSRGSTQLSSTGLGQATCKHTVGCATVLTWRASPASRGLRVCSAVVFALDLYASVVRTVCWTPGPDGRHTVGKLHAVGTKELDR
jgi:hypothetical protein